MANVLLTKPSDRADPRFRLPQSPHCPNDAPASVVAQGLAGTCGTCAWGFYTMEAGGHQQGENATDLGLIPVVNDEGRMGYRARCGKVALYRDNRGRVGPTRTIAGEKKFFPGIKGNWAYERYTERNPELMEKAVPCAAH